MNKKAMFGGLAVLLFAAVGGIVFHVSASADQKAGSRKPLPTRRPNLEIMACAHRGVKKIAPENTLAAIQKAITLGYDYVELDVRYTKDGVPVIMHDNRVDRTTSGMGEVGGYDLSSLKELDAGFWKGKEYRGETVPTVEEALRLMEGKIKLYLHQKKPPRRRLIRLLKEYGFYPENMILLGSGERTVKFLEYEPSTPILPRLHHAGEVDEILERFPSTKGFNTSCETLTPEMVTEAHKHGIMIFTNVLNVPPWKEKGCMRRPLELGSDVVQFDNMPLFFQVLEEVRREHAEPPEHVDYLCPDARDPEAAPDKVKIDCRLEYGEFARPPAGPVNELKVVAYNMERGMFKQQISVLKHHPDMKDADVLLISEADRYCSRVSYRNVARELARALEMNYVFGVQYVELPRKAEEPVNTIKTVCEHGNAVLSRYPVKNARRIQHRDSVNWYVPPGPEREDAQPRLGGAVTVAADIDLGETTVTVYSIHLSSNIQKEAVKARTSQAKELIKDAGDLKHPVIMGGDFNTIAYTIDTAVGTNTDDAVRAMTGGGFKDTHASLPRSERGTTGRDYWVRGVIDLIFVRRLEVLESGRCEPETCGHLSDHLPVWTKLRPD